MNTFESFSLEKIKTLSTNDKKSYIDKYFIPLNNGDHAQLIDTDTYKIIDDNVLKKTFFKRMGIDMTNYYFKDKCDLRDITYDIHSDTLTDGKLNLCPKLKHKYVPYSSFSEQIRNNVDLMLSHIKTVWCSGNEESYLFTLKYMSNMIKGNRNDSAIYLKGPQGAGKSLPLEFIRNNVIGTQLSHQGGSQPLKNRFNSELSGKILIVFEELESFSTSEWKAVSCTLKRNITSPVDKTQAGL